MFAFLDKIRETTWPLLGVALLGYGSTVLFLCATYHGPMGHLLHALEKATNGYIAPLLIASLIALAVFLLVVFGMGRLSVEDVGWRASALLTAVLVVFISWAAMQAALLLIVVRHGVEPTWHGVWKEHTVTMIAQIPANLLGNALVEETVFRGFFLPQLYLKASTFSRRGVALVLALLASQALFVLSHIPQRLYLTDLSSLDLIDDLLWLFGFGMILAVAYLVTRNLFVSVGLHALWNAPTVLLQVHWENVECSWWALTALLILAWWLTRTIRERVRAVSAPSAPSAK